MLLGKIRAWAEATPDRSFIGRVRRRLSGNGWIWDDAKSVYAPGNFKLYWETLAAVENYQRLLMSGNRDLKIQQYILDTLRGYFPGGNLRCCMLGCTETGGPETYFMKSGLFTKIDVFDIAEGLIEKKRAQSRGEDFDGIEYCRTNLNRHTFEPSSYDVAYSWGTVHHIENLEHLFSQVRQALIPGGVFILRDFVGPDRIRFTDRQLALANALLECIPASYRRRADGSLKNREVRVSERRSKRYDPSEAVRSSRILTVMKNHFTFDIFRETGGALLHPLLNGIAGNFEKDERGAEILGALVEIETTLTKSGLLPSDYVFLIARPKEAL
ncbi:MAG: class I SAM-dependent methyltransferase [Acidobacteria bacterium]|nr:class I SAM-dependent methyltransferase [Acidobacteriota bacterium]